MTKGGLMGKLVIGLAAFILLAAGGAPAGNALTDSSQGVTTTATTLGTNTNDDATTSTSTLETGEDLSGPCDEAEHATDPRRTGAARVATTVVAMTTVKTAAPARIGVRTMTAPARIVARTTTRQSTKGRTTACVRHWQFCSARSWPPRPSRSRLWARPRRRRSA